MRTSRWILLLAWCVFSGSVLAAACQRATRVADAETIKDLMVSTIDPAADVVWLSVTTVQSAEGTVETVPRSDEEWERVRQGAIALADGADLLRTPGRHVAGPNEKSETPGVELEPVEIEALIGTERAAWDRRAQGLHDAAVAARQAAEAKDPQRVFEIGEQIERACENCHAQFWYPNEKIPPFPASL